MNINKLYSDVCHETYETYRDRFTVREMEMVVGTFRSFDSIRKLERIDEELPRSRRADYLLGVEHARNAFLTNVINEYFPELHRKYSANAARQAVECILSQLLNHFAIQYATLTAIANGKAVSNV